MQQMRQISSKGKNLLLALYLILIHLLAVLFVYERWINPFFKQPEVSVEDIQIPTETVAVPTIQPIPSIEYPMPGQSEANTASDESLDALMIPVVGIRREQLQDTFTAARSGGRVHDAIDIMAAGGTPVVAVCDGEIAKFFDSVRGGTTIYQYSLDKKRVYYYAHLQKRADNIKETDFVKRGTVIGYVGDTGNAGVGNFHLHFAVTLLDDPKRIFNGVDINPYPLLKTAVESH